jgi:hypothetical protein
MHGKRAVKSALARELQENSDYLRDSGWHGTAQLMEAAAAEIERLSGRVMELDRREGSEAEVTGLLVPAIIRRFWS